MSEKDTLIVLGASYDSVADAELDYETVKALYEEAGVGHTFDAAVLERGDDGKIKVVDKHEASTRHGAWTGLAIGALAAVLPGIGSGRRGCGWCGDRRHQRPSQERHEQQ